MTDSKADSAGYSLSSFEGEHKPYSRLTLAPYPQNAVIGFNE
jgi:hypothetical protein